MSKLRIGVLMGGRSLEREVSFNSGRTICDHIDTSLYEIVPIFQQQGGALYCLPWQFLHRGKISDFQDRLAEQEAPIVWDDLKALVDYVYIAMHGRWAEDGTVQGMLEVLGIPYVGSGVYTSAISMDKIFQKKILSDAGIQVPRGLDLDCVQIKCIEDDEASLQALLDDYDLDFPLVVKPSSEGSSFGVKITNSIQDLHKAILQAHRIDPRMRQSVVVEQMLEGMEFSSILMRNDQGDDWVALSATEIVTQDNGSMYDYDQKYMPGCGTKFTPARCSDKDITRIQDVSIATARALELETMARVDGFLTKDGRVVVIDPNTLSGMTPSSFTFLQAAQRGMSHSDFINHIIKTDLNALGMLTKNGEPMNDRKVAGSKIRVAVLMGGNSSEREVSLDSGRNVVYKLSPNKYQAVPIFVDSNFNPHKINQALLVKNATPEIEAFLEPDMQIKWADLPTLCDFVFIGLHGGKGEDGSVQGMLEMMGLPYNGPGILASSLCMDKYKTNRFLRARGFEVPKGFIVTAQDWAKQKEDTLQRVEAELGWPVIVKPHNDGCSVMLGKASNKKDLEKALSDIHLHGRIALVEECIVGMELSVGVLGNDTVRVLPPTQTFAESDFLTMKEKFLPGQGKNLTPAPLSEGATKLVQQIAADVFKAIQASGYSRVDCFYQTAELSPTGKERIVILEINTLPALTPATCLFHQSAEVGMRPMDMIDKIIELGFERYRIRNVSLVVHNELSKQQATG
ncbi:ATP-grasp domain-containing protein [bacterium]|nr:ATP-grasp domain-containing protein [bacterium]MBT3903398.1 ATP-grasp domain-containing protein [bacterium]MBT4577593.1 ATP-grasp domain-containing protein [bacterium]MBT5345753.1 ATP-grasp domain-containing protein [bacterium]MBT6130906.1 ATP-grasp domain-containing protein [bacterium]